MNTDPRGPFRTVASVETTPEAHLVRFEECDHTARHNRVMTAVKPGEEARCFECGQAAAQAAKAAAQAACSHTFSSGRTAATGPNNDHLRCALCSVPMAWNGVAYVTKSAA